MSNSKKESANDLGAAPSVAHGAVGNYNPFQHRAKKKKKIEEGGPGSGKSYPNTMPIGLPMGEITIGKRKAFMDSNKATEQEISMSKVTSVGQQKYVPEKLSKMLGNYNKVKDFPVDVVMLKDGTYQILDGHHRYLARKLKNEKSIKARVYMQNRARVNEEQAAASLQGQYKLVKGLKSYVGLVGSFKKTKLGLLFFDPKGESKESLFFDFSSIEDMKRSGKTLTVPNGKLTYKFERQ